MASRFQCGYCEHLISVPDNLVGRKILCPMCEDPITVPKADPARKLGNPDLAVTIDKYRLDDWDKAFAKEIIAKAPAQKIALYKGLVEFMKIRRKRQDANLADELVILAVISESDKDEIRSKLKGAVKTAKSEFVECPNCFANIDSTSRACKFCGQRVGDEATVICPNCKAEHKKEKDLVHCPSCSANLKTGIVGGVGRCPACSKLVYGDPDICPHCKARIKTTGQKRKQREREESKKKSMRYAILAASACAIIFVWLAYRPVITMFRMVTVGYGRATLDERLRLFANHASGRFSDFRPYLDPAEDVDDEFVFVKTVFCGKQVDGDIDKVRKIVVESVELNDAKNEARIKAAVTVRIDNPRTRTGEMDNVRKVLGAGDREFTVNWKWVFKNGEWYYCGK